MRRLVSVVDGTCVNINSIFSSSLGLSLRKRLQMIPYTCGLSTWNCDFLVLERGSGLSIPPLRDPVIWVWSSQPGGGGAA